MIKKVAVCGLGLMGGSMAKTLKKYTSCQVYGWNKPDSVVDYAIADGAVDGYAQEAGWQEMDLLIVGLYPQVAINFLKDVMPKLKKGCLLVDMVGIKEYMVKSLEDDALAAGVHYIGGHPMAGREFSGYAYAQDTLFDDASMILVQTKSSPLWAVDEMEGFFYALGFANVVRCSARQHDKMIAFTSQLAHVVSSAYIKSPEALNHNGYSAGSYRDLTRVAKLNEDMWTELFIRNKEPLVEEIDQILKHLTEYRDAIQAENWDELRQLLKEGREIKESIG